MVHLLWDLPFRGLCSIWLFSHLQGVYCSFSLLIFLKLIFICLHIDIWTCVISILIHQCYFMSVVLLVWASCLALGTWTLNGTQVLLICLGPSSSSWSWRRLHSEKNSYKWLKVKSGITPRDGESWRNWLASSLVFFPPQCMYVCVCFLCCQVTFRNGHCSTKPCVLYPRQWLFILELCCHLKGIWWCLESVLAVHTGGGSVDCYCYPMLKARMLSKTEYETEHRDTKKNLCQMSVVFENLAVSSVFLHYWGVFASSLQGSGLSTVVSLHFKKKRWGLRDVSTGTSMFCFCRRPEAISGS